MSFSSIAFLSLYACIQYLERKAVELKLTGIGLNRSKKHIGKRTTDKGVQVGIFFIKNSLAFQIEVGIVFSHTVHTNPYNFAVTQWSP